MLLHRAPSLLMRSWPTSHDCLVCTFCTPDALISNSFCSPVSYCGQHIVPEGIFDFLHRRSLMWECFCSLISGQPTPACFVNEFISGHTVVRCHHVDNLYGFYSEFFKCDYLLFDVLISYSEYRQHLSHCIPGISL